MSPFLARFFATPRDPAPWTTVFLFHAFIVLGWILIYLGYHYLQGVRRAEADKWRLEVAVREGRQIGPRLMEQYCQAQDQAGVAGYLETDRPENVDFYRRFDFEVTATRPVLGVPNYFMRRKGRKA